MNINISPVFDLPGDALYGERRAPGPGGRWEEEHNKVNIYQNIQMWSSAGGIDFHGVT